MDDLFIIFELLTHPITTDALCSQVYFFALDELSEILFQHLDVLQGNYLVCFVELLLQLSFLI